MRNILFSLILLYSFTYAQEQTHIKGQVLDSYTLQPIVGVLVQLENHLIQVQTDETGSFNLSVSSTSDFILKLSIEEYESQQILLKRNDSIIDIGQILLKEAVLDVSDLNVVFLSQNQLNSDEGSIINTTGLLHASKDIFLRTAAFSFSSTFFRMRGYNASQGELLLNGIIMNKLSSGKPEWSNWGGLNDVMRDQQEANGLQPSEFSFGGIAGSNNMMINAFAIRKGSRISMASSNRSYSARLMATYASGINKNNWAYAISASKRYAKEGYNDGTLYDAFSIFTAIQKRINKKHSINFTGLYTPNKRGKSSANTQEVYDLKDTKYNAYWGNQSDAIRNSRIKEVQQPLLMLNHYWDITSKIRLNTNIAYQFGTIKQSRLDYGGATLIEDSSGNQSIIGGGTNPDPTYYQKLPSYFLRTINNPDYEGAYLAQRDFQKDGQVDWQSLYEANNTITTQGRNAIYALYADTTNDKKFVANTLLVSELNEHLILSAKLDFQSLNSQNYAEMKDLLGANGYLDIDAFSESIDEAQNNLQQPNRVVQEGDRFKYNYKLKASVITSFIQAEFTFPKIDFYVSAQFSQHSYLRNGLYENGRFIGARSFGNSEQLSFQNLGIKTGLTYKLTGRHLGILNIGTRTKAPTIQNSFSNIRENNDVVFGLTNEEINTVDLSYIFRTLLFQGRLTGYYTQFENATKISYFYADGLNILVKEGPVENSAFVQEVLTGIDKRHLGIEFGVTVKLSESIKLNGVIALGDYRYTNNPNVYLTSSAIKEFQEEGILVNEGNRIDFGSSSLNNYHISGGPERAYSIGFEYRDPKFWWFGINGNYFSNAYSSVAPITRTESFAKDYDGLPISDYNETIARELLRQEQFQDYFICNAVGGKSWRLKSNYIGFFATIGNLLNTAYKTGGFEQSRNANYTVLRDDKARDIPLFGSKYWFGYGSTYYLNIYYRF